ncbi:hypothetical protein POVWA2_042800 [Plasmodium ovale wallikeri]|uniref:Uncharacterized protein n=1 Tax=Plasmodium ovale wallikeri TaxID=864142 RepID=A0A1A8ZC43_PLAOA|nr:hypothetical protein POVWA1_044200 [Plasmodium ovale wallikeri]SBT41973.1 hypothetical protein POVWA2_042800 [Plasmodium ovale wallikeri]
MGCRTISHPRPGREPVSQELRALQILELGNFGIGGFGSLHFAIYQFTICRLSFAVCPSPFAICRFPFTKLLFYEVTKERHNFLHGLYAAQFSHAIFSYT